MKVYLDDQLLELEVSTVGDAVEEASDHAGKTGRIVVEVSLNGDQMSGEVLDAAMSRIFADGDELKLISADTVELAVEVLDEVRGQISEVQQRQQEAADLLQQDDAPAALAVIAEIVDGWLWVQQGVSQSTSLVGLRLDEVKVEGEPVEKYAAELLKQLAGLKELIINQDLITMADALAYEWPEVCEKWDKLVLGLIEAIQVAVKTG
ncbi:hypothetical protein KS4_18630 [Poriferisphaera corsica]|uniref:Uncharacterized protein n=1 Tax=Poriferisphaera corsica TaxID=2528020 RepID=A0A517YU80_9BACT|nr:hypothetical protein [Poriferisphaera corsica]QDU33805.1 hypothetical protein KS4_18630 [Poriferisphaera corsica]